MSINTQVLFVYYFWRFAGYRLYLSYSTLMNKTVIAIYLIVFFTYILFTRQPDYFDSETTTAVVHITKDSTGADTPFAFYRAGMQDNKVDTRYLFRNYREGDACRVIYNTSKPQQGAVYTFWGYWLTWQELLASIALVVVLFQAAKAITRNPTPEGLLSELEDDAPKPRKRRYDD